jgi:hypothetical protein
MRLCLNGNQIWMAGIRAPGSTAHIGFRSPPAFLPLSGGGGGGGGGSGIEGAPLQRSRSEHPDQRRTRRFQTPPAFLPLSGGGGSGIRRASSQRPRSKRPDQRRSGDPILLSCSAFNQRGPFPRHVIPPQPSSSPLLPCVPLSP